ncbi:MULTISPECIES: PepSY-associated TM helix domain-containing protein [Dyella]|uniref:PepSY domain-containing protein n=2 Tax=Dyella TaxID=231454 RepID=A0A4R0Z319_9GAMM|nr:MULTISPECIES: PepSY-associated TM helix domain-containing protein [Dyella]TBR39698.1 PepSY domain-containing protein [Dyella terrae]TCI12720.1 PepSY domain-containing protein [Dyella soli]
MKSSTVRTYTTVHTWTGLIAGFGLFIAFFAGALTVFHHDIATWQSPPWRMTADADVTPDQLAQRLLQAHPDARKDFGIVLAPPGVARPPYAYWPEGGEERFATASAIDQPTEDATRGNLADFVYALHDSLGFPTVGMYFMGIVSILYGLALFSGLIIHLPHLVRDLFAMRSGKNLKRLWQDAHNVIGVLSLPFHLIFAMTGALLCLFAITFATLNVVAFDGKLFDAFGKAIATAPVIAPSGEAAPMLTLDELMQRARVQALKQGVTSFEPDYVHFSNYGDRKAVVEVRGLSQHTLGTYGTVAMNAVDGSVLETHVGKAQNTNGITNSAMYSLHFGSFGGRTVQWLYFVLGLMGAFLFYSGNLLWIESRRKRRMEDQPMKTRIMASATVGVCIGSCLGIAASFGATMLADVYGADAGLWQRVACYGFVIASAIYAWFRPLPRATRDLLWLNAVLYVALGAIDLVRNLQVWTQPWTPQASAVLGVDLTGIAMGIGFAFLARASWRRATQGDPNSVWSLDATTAPAT